MKKDDVVSQHIQDCFLYYCIMDIEVLRACRTGIKSKYFESPMTRDYIELCYRYYDNFQEAPHDHMYDEVHRFVQNFDEKKYNRYFRYFERIRDLDPPNKKYTLSRINGFVQAREWEEALLTALPRIQKAEYDDARKIVLSAIKSGVTLYEEGIDYPRNWPPTYHTNSSFSEVICDTGLSVIDNRLQGLRRTQLVCIFAGYKVGKTWGCIQLANQARLLNNNVLMISHEASVEEIEMRLDMMQGSLVSTSSPEDVEFTTYNNRGVITGKHVEFRDTVHDLEAVKKVRDIANRWKNSIHIKKYPMGTCTIEEIERYMDHLETFHHFIPDMLVNDYVEKMLMSSAYEGRDRINETYMNLKRIADERNILVVTASQVKTKFLESSNISEAGAPAEDARKLGNIDLGLFFGMNRSQARRNLMQAYVLVNRSGPAKFGCVVNRNLQVGQLALSCWPIQFDADGNEVDSGRAEEVQNDNSNGE